MLPDIRAVVAAVVAAVGLMMIAFALVATFRVAQEDHAGSLQADLAQRGRAAPPATPGQRAVTVIETPGPHVVALPRVAPLPVIEIRDAPIAEPRLVPVEAAPAPAEPPPLETAPAHAEPIPVPPLPAAPHPVAAALPPSPLPNPEPGIGGPLAEPKPAQAEAARKAAEKAAARKAAARKARAARIARARARAAQAQGQQQPSFGGSFGNPGFGNFGTFNAQRR